MVALQGCSKEIGLELTILRPFPNSLDELCSKSAHFMNTYNLANHVAIVNAIEIQGLDDITNFDRGHCLLQNNLWV